MRLRTFLLMGLLGACAFGQQPDVTAPGPITGPVPATAPGPNPLVTLASEFFEHDYVNVFAFGDGVLDTNNPVVTSTGQTRNTLGTGFEVGGGITASHGFRDAQLFLSYQGAYRDYQSNVYNSGANQNLSIGYSKRLSRHLSMNIGVGAGTYLYGGTFTSNEAAGTASVITNPLSPETRFVGSNIGFTYQQTRRLSYSVYGDFFLSRYNFPGAIGTTGVTGGAAVNYRLTARTTLSGSYTHSYFKYQQNAGQDSVDQLSLSLAHQFSRHWFVTVSGGEARSHANGITAVPFILQLGNGQSIGGYYLGAYDQVAYIPSFAGSVSHSYRRSVFSVSVGEGIAGSGNGYFLASRSIYVNGVYSYSWRNQNISAGGSVYRLSSVANTVSSSYSSAIFSASYGRSLIRYVALFLRYDYNHYGQLQPFAGISDNRISFGFNFSSRSVPLTLF